MTTTPERPTVIWTEIPVADLDRACDFYSDVFGWTMTVDDSGPNPMAHFNGSNGQAGHLYPGSPATDGQGATVHLAVAGTVEAAMELNYRLGQL